MREDEIASLILQWVSDAYKEYGVYTSTHEAYGVLAEEMLELLQAIRSNTMESIRHEAIQVASVAHKLAIDCEDLNFRKRSHLE